MFSPAVDTAWHEMLGTPAYVALCQETAWPARPPRRGQRPRPDRLGCRLQGDARAAALEIWFTDAHGTVDEQAVARYRETGTVVAEWDCGPMVVGDDVAPDRPETARR